MDCVKLYKFGATCYINNKEDWWLSPSSFNALLLENYLYEHLVDLIQDTETVEKPQLEVLSAPIGHQELWAAGVTYFRSKQARESESSQSGSSVFYDKVYDAERPELFFKSNPQNISGHGGEVNVRKDSTWTVPEPELTLFISKYNKIEGYTIGNDMSARDIEGSNPLYLPQAKTYKNSAALGPCLIVPKEPIESFDISMQIFRNEELIFKGASSTTNMKRSFDELSSWLLRGNTSNYGYFLMTGTGIVPPDSVTLNKNDEIHIQIEHIGELISTVKIL